jgi:hypothetical protein
MATKLVVEFFVQRNIKEDKKKDHYLTEMKIKTGASSFVKLLQLILILMTIFTIANSSTVSISVVFAQNIINTNQTAFPASNTSTTQDNIPTAESVFQSQSMILPPSVRTFIWYVVNEAHENSANERHKYVSDHNPIYIPTNLVVPEGTAITFLDADAPWDTPHPHTINIMDSSGNTVYTTGKLDYTNSSTPKVLPAGKYSVMDTKYTWMKGNITVSSSQKSTGDLAVGGFYAPTSQVANNKDNDGGVHSGWLGYYRTEFPKDGFKILTEYNFHYATCKYCPGGFWPDQKTADHTLFIYSTDQPVSVALAKLAKMVWNNVYI